MGIFVTVLSFSVMPSARKGRAASGDEVYWSLKLLSLTLSKLASINLVLYSTSLIIAVLSIACISLLLFMLVRFSFIASGFFSEISGFTSTYGSSFSFQAVTTLFLLPSLWATVIGLLLIQRKVKKIKTREWAPLLEEDAPAAIKLLMELD